MKQFAVISLFVAVVIALAGGTDSVRNDVTVTSGTPKCPSVCRIGLNAEEIVRQECKKNRAWCSPNLPECVMAPCTEILNDKSWKGWKCVCPACLNRCYSGLLGLKRASTECAVRTCHSMVKPNAPCVLQTCRTKFGRTGFKCGCQVKPTTCPDVCRVGKLGSALVFVECSDQNRPTCLNSDHCCEIQDCRIGTEPGTQCACPDVLPPRCPDDCHLGFDADHLARRECSIKRSCRDGKCMVRNCYRDGMLGVKCGCRDEKLLCPDKCRFDDGAKDTATTECKERPLCRSGKCDVRLCYSDGQKGYKCGCKDEVPQPRCPDRCRFDSNSKKTATGECDRPHFCSDGKCEVRECYGLEGKGYKCGCKDETPPTV